MEPALILLGALFVVGLALWLLDRRGRTHAPLPDIGDNNDDNGASSGDCAVDCCAVHVVCPSEQLARAQLCDIAYYDDEELDAFAGRGADEYEPSELEQWRDVLYTLHPDDRLGWERSVKRRGIVMPAVIRDELIMLINSPG